MPRFYAQNDLFNNSANDTVQTSSTVESGSTGFRIDFSNTILSEDNVRTFIIQLNSFVLAVCIVYSILFIMDFYFYRMSHSYGDLKREKIGVESLVKAVNLWFSYLFCLIALGIYGYFSFFGFITVLVYIVKLLHYDTPAALSIIHDYMAFNGIHSNYKKIVAPLIKLLRLDFKK
jgi:hypothetical protein